MRARLRQLAPRIARLAAFVMVLMVGLHVLLGRLVRAETENAMLDLGAGLVGLGATSGPEGDRVLELNGVQIRFEVDSRDETVAAVLDRAGAECSPTGDRTLRGGDGARGFVACAVQPVIAGPVVGESPRAEPGYRYVYAQPGEAGGALAVTVMLESGIDLASLFPSHGDAPGSDAPGLPRPPGASRTFSAFELGHPQQITMYVARDGDPAALEAWYRARLPALGWRPLDGAPRAGGPRVLMVERSGSLATMVFGDYRGAGTSVVMLTSLDETKDPK